MTTRVASCHSPRIRRLVGRAGRLVEGWTVAAASYDEMRALVEDGVSFALASAAEDRGETADEAQFAGVALEHYVPAPA